jgi:hypothetical protein
MSGETLPTFSPAARYGRGAVAGVLTAALALAAAAVYGAVVGDPDAWRDGRSVIVERESGNGSCTTRAPCICALVPDERGASEIRLDPAFAPAGPGCGRTAGAGALVRAAAGPGTADGAVFLVTEAGRRYAVPGEPARAALGYAGVPPLALPAATVALIPAGPALDPAAPSVRP